MRGETFGGGGFYERHGTCEAGGVAGKSKKELEAENKLELGVDESAQASVGVGMI